jgi:hypothetical protein
LKPVHLGTIAQADTFVIHFLLGYLYVTLPLYLTGILGTGWTGGAYLSSGIAFGVFAAISLGRAQRLEPHRMITVRNLLTAISLILLYIEELSTLWPLTLALGYITLLGGAAGAIDHAVTVIYSPKETFKSFEHLAFLLGAASVLAYPEPIITRPVALAGGFAILLLTLPRHISGTTKPRPTVRILPLYPSETAALTRLSPTMVLYGLAFGLTVLPIPLWLTALGADLRTVGLVMATSFLAQLLGRGLRVQRGPGAQAYPAVSLALLHAIMSQRTLISHIALLFAMRGLLWGIASRDMALRFREFFRPAAEPTASTVAASLLAGFGGAGMLISLGLLETAAFSLAMLLAAITYAVASATTLLLLPGRPWGPSGQPSDDPKQLGGITGLVLHLRNFPQPARMGAPQEGHKPDA